MDITGGGPSSGGETEEAPEIEVVEIEVVGPEPAPTVGARLPHQPALDGLRGLAVAAVVVYHGAAADGIAWLQPVTRGGFLGVSAFFTLSGFLICSLLLREREQAGTISLRGFWERRARRLLPAAYLVIGAVVVLTPLVGTQSQLDQLPGDVCASLLYVAVLVYLYTVGRARAALPFSEIDSATGRLFQFGVVTLAATTYFIAGMFNRGDMFPVLLLTGFLLAHWRRSSDA